MRRVRTCVLVVLIALVSAAGCGEPGANVPKTEKPKLEQQKSSSNPIGVK